MFKRGKKTKREGKIVSEEEIILVGYKFIQNRVLPTVLVMHQFL